jgi:hypothetical protein
MYGEHPDVATAFIRSFPGAKGPNAQRTNTLTFGFLHRISMLVVEAQAHGEVAKDLDPLACAQNVFGLYFFSLLSWVGGFATLEDALERNLRRALELQIRGFGVTS